MPLTESPWTPELVQQLKALWEQGLPTAEIGRRLGISKNAVVSKAHRIGLKGRPSPLKRPPTPKYAPPPRACVWPEGDPGTKDFRFCGQPPLPGRPYCAPHTEVARAKVQPEAFKPLKEKTRTSWR